jgi:DNA-binding response OmpR family regulator
VIEDDYDISVVFARAARSAKCNVQVIRSGDTALTWLQSTEPDLVVLDLFLPRVSGEDILEYIRSSERLDNTRIIVATAYAQLEEKLRDQANIVLMKPVSFKVLRDMIVRLTGTGELGRVEGYEGS